MLNFLKWAEAHEATMWYSVIFPLLFLVVFGFSFFTGVCAYVIALGLHLVMQNLSRQVHPQDVRKGFGT